MEMRTVLLLLLLVLGVGATAFAQPPIGTWEWLETEAADGSVTTPDDLGYHVRREYTEDRTYRLYHGNTLVSQGQWGVVYVVVGHACYEILETACGGSWEYFHFIWTHESLTLHNGYTTSSIIPPIERYEARGPVSSTCSTWGDLKTLYR